MTIARPIACSSVRESATDASTARQSISCWADRRFPSTPDAFLVPTCSTNLRTSSNERISNDALAEADPGRSVPSTRVEASGSIANRPFSGGPAFEEYVVSVCKALFTIWVPAEQHALQAFGGFVQSLSGTAEAGSIWFIARSLAGANMELKAPSSLTSSLLTVVKPAIADCSSRAVLVDTNVASCAC